MGKFARVDLSLPIELRLYTNECVECGEFHYCPKCGERLSSLLLCMSENIRFTHEEVKND